MTSDRDSGTATSGPPNSPRPTRRSSLMHASASHQGGSNRTENTAMAEEHIRAPPSAHTTAEAAHPASAQTPHSIPSPSPPPSSTTTRPLHHTQLIFPSASIPISHTLAQISRDRINISNRLRSIASDAEFIAHVSRTLRNGDNDVPLIANERCGSWYVPPGLKRGSAYFKSTDGHWGEWGFSLRRLNLGVLEVAGTAGGCVIVDSTRRGKHLPDALSKTVPIWCAVMNRLLFPDRHDAHRVVILPEIISESEASQIDARLPSCTRDAQALGLDLESLRKSVQKPLKPFWIARSLGLLPENVNQPPDTSVLPIYLCMASEHHEQRTSRPNDEGYVQGAGDDGENWACGLTAELYWANREMLLSTSEEDLSKVIADICAAHALEQEQTSFVAVAKAPWLEIGRFSTSLRPADADSLLIICTAAGGRPPLEGEEAKRMLQLNCAEGKAGGRKLREELEKLTDFIQIQPGTFSRVQVCCSSGRDVSIGVALALLCLLGDDHGYTQPGPKCTERVDKTVIKKTLSWILTSIPSANPSRATLNSVNAFLMKPG